MKRLHVILTTLMLMGAMSIFSASTASAHCDTMNGPVVLDARAALASGDISPVMKWVTEADEAEVMHAFERTLSVRDQSESVREMADMYFFETVVRLHRMSEGVGYTGLKAATSVDPGIAAADHALESGSVDALEHLLLDHVRDALHTRFAEASAALEHADHNTDAGRDFVEAYVRYTHLIEEIQAAIAHSSGHSSGHGHTSSSHAHH